jgi:uncharacterized protein (TIGR03067 family)
MNKLFQTLSISLFILLMSGCGQSATVESERDNLKGKWEVVFWELNGQKLTEGADVGVQYEFDGDQFRVLKSSATIGPWIKYDLDVDAEPKVLKIHAKLIKEDKIVENTINELIYRVEGDELQLCSLSVITPTKKHPASFSSKEPNVRLKTLKRIPFADPEEEKLRNKRASDRIQDSAFVDLQPMVSGRYQGKFDVDFHERPWTRNIGKRWWQDLSNLRDIRKLVFRSCDGVGDEEMPLVGKLAGLEHLDLSFTDVSDAGIEKLFGLNNLETLDLSFTSIGNRSVPSLVKIPKLKKLILKGTLFSSQGIEDLREKRKNVEIVWLRPFTESQQKAAKAIARLGFKVDDDYDTAHRSKIATCQITLDLYIKLQNPVPTKQVTNNPSAKFYRYERDVEPALVASYLEQLPSPLAIAVADTKMDDAIFTCVKNIQGLIQLDLKMTKVTDAGVAELKNNQSLQYLNLRGTKITNVSIPLLASIRSLKTIDITKIKLEPGDMEPLLKLDNLTLLKVDRKQLSQEQILQFRNKNVDIQFNE